MGEEAATVAAGCGADVVLNGVTGSIGLRPTLAALEAGSVLALANKESLIIGGPLVKAAARPDQIVPVDSEHSAIAQALRGGRAGEVRRLVVTASGGPFRGRSRAELGDVTPEQALAHPNFAMGRVITTNSATLVNKGLEVIEAHLLFDVPFDRIDVVVHPQQQIHSMVEFHDGSTIAQMGPPRMLVPIALGLSWPERLEDVDVPCDWSLPQSWDFHPLDDDAFPAVRLARQVGEAGGTYPAVYNAANEVGVDAFHEGTIASPTSSTRSSGSSSTDDGSTGDASSVEGVLAADRWARRRARRAPRSPEQHPRPGGGTMTVLAFVLGVLAHGARRRAVHRPPRGRPPRPREALRRPGDPVHGRLRAHHLVARAAATPSTASRRSRSAATSG